MKRILSITALSFIAGGYLYMIAKQINQSNASGAVLGLSFIVVLFYNMFLKYELRANRRHLKDTRHYAQKYWENEERYL